MSYPEAEFRGILLINIVTDFSLEPKYYSFRI